ncbi:MAG TPA: MAPEG family protein [Polyangiaceae bacterium]|nr:MAPEG family protein [Polyangiaceae bacterium]
MTHEAAIPTGPVLVTIAYFAVYYALHLRVLRTKMLLKAECRVREEEFDRYFSQDRRMLAADRSLLNMLEHMPPFVCLLWLNVAFVGSFGATVAGSVYVAARAAYPFLLGARMGTELPWRLLVATYTGYGVLLYLGAALCIEMVR